MNQTAIVIGATGLVGRALTERLATAGHVERIVTLTRRPAPHGEAKVLNQVVDFDRLEGYAEAFRGDIFFSCLGTTRKQAGSRHAQRVVDLAYQYRAARLAADQGVRHYLLVSSSGADARSRNAYLRMKGELEQKVLALPFERISIFQPSLLVGRREQVRWAEKLGGWLLPVFCAIPGLRRYRPIAAWQVAAKMVQVSRSRAPGVAWYRLDEIFDTDPGRDDAAMNAPDGFS